MIKLFLNYYRSKFSNRTFVLKLSGKIIADPEALTRICEDIKELKENNVNVIIVHGGGVQADDLSDKLGFEIKKHEGRRITDSEQIQVAQMMYGGSVNLSIIAQLKKLGIQAARAGSDGNVFEVVKRPIQDIDFGFAGDVVAVNNNFIQKILAEGMIPVIPSLAISHDGEILNVNADTLAIEIATSMKADKLIFFSDVDGVKNGDQIVSVLTPTLSEQLIEENIITDGMIVKVQNCLTAIGRGVKRVHILNGFKGHTLHEEIFSHDGVGTMIVSDEEAQIYNQETVSDV